MKTQKEQVGLGQGPNRARVPPVRIIGCDNKEELLGESREGGIPLPGESNEIPLIGGRMLLQLVTQLNV